MGRVPGTYKNQEAFVPGRWKSHDGMTLIVSIDNGRWHLSIAHPDRDPTWKEIHDARYKFVPDEVTMVMFLPPKAQYVNLHEHCFHLWEIRKREE